MRLSNKKIVSLFLSLALIVSILVGSWTTVFAEDVKTLTIVHVNDVHGQVVEDEGNGVIGYAKLATIVKELREDSNVLLLNAGDTLHGTNFATLNRGEAVINLMNLMGFNAMVPGNHEFNYGYERLLELRDMAEFPILGANIVKEADGTSDFESYIIEEFEGFKVGIFGLSTEETKVKAHPKYSEGLRFDSPIEVAKKLVGELQAEGVDLIIGLVHLGLDEESAKVATTSEMLAEAVEGIDIIVDGHSHHKLPEGKLVNDTLIVQAHEWTKNIGIVEVKMVDGEKEIVAKLLDYEAVKDVEGDKEVLAEIKKVETVNEEIMNQVIGKNLILLDGVREHVRGGETNLGNLATDAMLKASGADVVITNGGGIRASIEVGDITLGNAFEVFPFGNTLVTIEVTGATIKAALEHGVDAYPEVAGKFPHVAGMTYKIDPSKEAGNRVVEILVNGEEIDLEKTYALATNDFMASGGDGYEMFIGAPVLMEHGLLYETVVDYIKELGEVAYEVEGRIVEFVPEEVEPQKYVVVPGDVLWKIARKFGTTWEVLAEYNKLKNPHLIFPGQVILIP
ncbi:MAG: LysM peptidoglycan-binding domain-containing protein [Tissierellia bacterium]|nr:LysM peptidoglycan-binding domain-containing protein [Tissierellia bacterium]